ncbi:phage holin family protein [Arthrobacter oryzae]|uniref:Putative superfamily III holin-X n=1 Tax=Arthrobacter oryzae TaxID=409290 RepID=A0A495ETB3_9MICC|nr:phage holin family protein [Arthrobacter oryzae]RKR19586.1 putative superfamily III holin-X [Arthrobacter oryzae]
MSGRHSGGTGGGLRISALPKTLKMIFKLAPRQLTDEIALAKAEIKRKGIQLGIAGAFFAVALVFVGLLVIGLVVAAIMGLATIMPAWLAALLVCAVCLVIAAIGALIGLNKFKAAMPLVPEDTLRGLKHDLGIAKEGSAFDAAVLDPNSEQYKAAKAAKEAAAAKAKAEREAKIAAQPDLGPAPTEAELRRRLEERRTHLTGVRDDLGRELDVKTQAALLLAGTQALLQHGKERLDAKIAGFRSSARSSAQASGNQPTSADAGLAGQIKQRWRPLAVLAASAAALAVLVRKLIKG